MDIQKEREAFESKLKQIGKVDDSNFTVADDGSYEWDSIHFAWTIWQAAKAQEVPNLHYEILVKSIIEHVDSHLEENYLEADLFDKGWNAAMRCVRNNIAKLEAQEQKG